jgi:hypothetical protein
MATIKSDATPETVLPEGTRTGNSSSPSPEFISLVDFCLSAELDDPTLRILEVVSDDKNAPEFIKLKYSYPKVTLGAPGYKDSKDKVVSFK